MDMKKWLLTGTLISTLGAFSACSEDSSSDPVGPVDSSGSLVPDSSGDVPGSSDGQPTAKSSSSIADNAAPQMACSEIMYNAPGGSPLEWVEVYIAGGMDMDNMQNFFLHLSGAVDYTFPEEPLKKGEYVVVANDTAEFRKMYPTFAGRLFGPWVGGTTVKLTNEGDVVNVKVQGEGDVSCAFSNEPPWPSLADGKGRTLVYVGGNAAQPNSWAASKVDKGNPGVGGDEWVAPTQVRINEIMPFKLGEKSWIEVYNAGDQPVDITGWTLEVKRRDETLTISAGVVPAKGYLVLDAETAFDKELVVAPDGGEFYLRGPQEGDESSIWVPATTATSGVVDLSDGSTAQGPLAAATPGEKNSALAVGSLYINEIHYHPASANTTVPFEFMEVVNGSETPVTLYSSSVSKGWKVEGVNLEFASATTIPAKGLILLIPETLEDVDMDSFGITAWSADFVRETYQIPADVQIVTYKGKLSNRGETIAVKEPYSKETVDGIMKYFYIWHDATLYSDAWDGLAEADGYGFSLQRVDTSTMGYEAKAWKAVKPTPGTL
ncbi:lamin tail domain-containing protein [Fibrobacter sp.]|uniref:lamin tail domain-containing protein n=1 Tax=Fibrobacter sp. TaxID=35828 RepID=UPI0025BACA92|nr:lamin tail domain-containing protein [Fibrobacter sp.]MBR4007382.1 lamin tail domain-containing protein [Fibrobacter sp.]